MDHNALLWQGIEVVEGEYDDDGYPVLAWKVCEVPRFTSDTPPAYRVRNWRG